MPQSTEVHPGTTSQFMAVTRRSGLIEAAALDDALREVKFGQCETSEIVSRLIEAKLLTPWQVGQLLKGRSKGFRLGKYLLLEELGRGGMAKVFLARHQMLKNLVAVKVLFRAPTKKASLSERFLREAQSAAALAHPNIVRVFDVDVQQDRHYLVMEYIKGCSLQQRVNSRGALPCDKAARFALQVAQGLTCAHDAGLIHRDIKPANLLIDESECLKISDFGLARIETPDDDASLTMQHDEQVLGTADYIAPEQAVNSHRIDARADLYSLGGTLYFMLTGQAPFPTGRIVERLTKHCTEEPTDVRTFRSDVPDSLLAILHKLTRKKPEQRYSSAGDVAQALQQWLVPSPTRIVANDSADDLLALAPDDDSPVSQPAVDRPAAEPMELAIDDVADESVIDASAAQLDQEVDGGKTEIELTPLVASEDAFDELFDDFGEGGADLDFPLGDSDIHGNDDRGATSPLARDTDASRRLLATRSFPANQNKLSDEPKPNVLAEMYEGFKRGEYPLWLLIGAGVILGGILLFVAYSYFSSFTVPETPNRIGE